MTFSRSYKDGDEWKNATSFGRDDLLTVAEAARMAWHWIYRNAKKANSNGSEPNDEAPPGPAEDIPF